MSNRQQLEQAQSEPEQDRQQLEQAQSEPEQDRQQPEQGQQEPEQDTQQQPEQDQQEPEPEQDQREPERTDESREAARYRRRLRETERERDALRATVEGLQRAEAERIAGATLKAPAGLWAAGAVLADLLDDEGRVDPAKVQAAALAAAGAIGLEPVRRGVSRLEGHAPELEQRNGWAAAFSEPRY